MELKTLNKAHNLKAEITHLESAIWALEEICEQGEMPYRMELHFEFYHPVILPGPRNETEIESIPHSEDLMNFFKATLENYKKRLKKAEQEFADL